MYRILGIDPGKTGCLAVHFSDTKKVELHKMPLTPGDLLEFLTEFGGPDSVAMCEKISNPHRAGNNASSSAKFAHHLGSLETALLATKTPSFLVTPKVWMQAVCGALPKDKMDRKREIQRQMQQRYPSLKVFLWGADGLGLLDYALGPSWARVSNLITSYA